MGMHAGSGVQSGIFRAKRQRLPAVGGVAAGDHETPDSRDMSAGDDFGTVHVEALMGQIGPDIYQARGMRDICHSIVLMNMTDANRPITARMCRIGPKQAVGGASVN